jgi:hypothetical protein
MTEEEEANAKLAEAWLNLGRPGPEHALLAGFVGTWEQDVQTWAYPGGPMMVVKSCSEMTLRYGGRYLQQIMKGGIEIPGQADPFEGLGLYGYDNQARRHFFSWIDNSSTMLMSGTGSSDETGRITYGGEVPDARTGTAVAFKLELWKEGEDRFIYDNFVQMPDQSWFKKYRMIATRV